jgi:hypothetical protein
MKNKFQKLFIALLFLCCNLSLINAQHAVAGNIRMNVLYIGADNPIEVAVADYPVEAIQVKVSDGIISGSNGKYNWAVSRPGAATISVFANGKELAKYNYRVKRIPDPIARLDEHDSGAMSTGEFKAQEAVIMFMENFDYDASCEVQGFTMLFIRKKSDIFDVVNTGSSFNEKTRKYINDVQSGDVIYIENIRCRCPGDYTSRRINNLVFKIM